MFQLLVMQLRYIVWEITRSPLIKTLLNNCHDKEKAMIKQLEKDRLVCPEVLGVLKVYHDDLSV